jgi:hypothetical protein
MPFMNNVEKCGGARGATNDVTIWRIRVACWLCKATLTRLRAHAHTDGQVCDTNCFSTATMTGESASVTLYVHCLSCLIYCASDTQTKLSTEPR